MWWLSRQYKLARHFIALIENPGNADQIIARARPLFADVKGGSEKFLGPMMEKLSSVPQLSAMYERRYIPLIPSTSELLQMPLDSLGHAYGTLIQTMGDDPLHLLHSSSNSLRDADFATYIIELSSASRPLWSTVLGYDFLNDENVLDELGIESFSVVQTHSAIPFATLSAGLLHILTSSPALVGAATKFVFDGFHRGKHASIFLAVPWENLLPLPLESVQSQLGVLPKTVPASTSFLNL